MGNDDQTARHSGDTWSNALRAKAWLSKEFK